MVVPGQSTAPPALLLAQLFVAAGLPAGALNVLTGGDMSLAADVAQDSSIACVTYSGNKQVRIPKERGSPNLHCGNINEPWEFFVVVVLFVFKPALGCCEAV